MTKTVNPCGCRESTTYCQRAIGVAYHSCRLCHSWNSDTCPSSTPLPRNCLSIRRTWSPSLRGNRTAVARPSWSSPRPSRHAQRRTRRQPVSARCSLNLFVALSLLVDLGNYEAHDSRSPPSQAKGKEWRQRDLTTCERRRSHDMARRRLDPDRGLGGAEEIDAVTRISGKFSPVPRSSTRTQRG